MKDSFVKFIDIYKNFILNSIKFQGRTDRTHYWVPVIADAIVIAIIGCFDVKVLDTIANILSVLIIVPTISAGCRRLQDTNRNPLWILINLVPCVGQIIFIIFAVQRSVDDGNKFGSQMIQ